MPRDALANPVVLAALGALLERPMHAYQLAGALAERGVPANRGSLYDTLEAMTRAGWVQPQPAQRDGARPQRTPYALTPAGQAELARRLDRQVREPHREFPEFLGAVSHLGVLGRERAAEALNDRAARLQALIADGQHRLEEALAGDVPRLFVIEADYALAMLRAERDWVLATADDVTSGRARLAAPAPPSQRRRQGQRPVNDGTPSGLTFGIYPGGAIGNTELRPLPDQPDKINQALDELQGSPDRPFTVRAYDAYADPGDTAHATTLHAPAGYDRYLGHGRTLDLVAQYHSRSGDIDGYCGFVEKLIDSHGARLATLQITEEPNITGDPNLDGFYPRVTEALIAGVHTAKHKAQSAGHPALKVGCNTSPLLGPGSGFLTGLTRAGGERFIEDLDYIGLDFFPDVFRPIAPASLGPAVHGLLQAHRRDNLTQAGLGHLPLVITEHGWPTGPGRTQTRQADVLRTVIDAIAARAKELNITGYIHHTLRDACSSGDGLFCQFGLMTDDYTAKPAFHVYRNLIDALSR